MKFFALNVDFLSNSQQHASTQDQRRSAKGCWTKNKELSMANNERKTSNSTFAIVGLVAGVLTVVLVFFALKGC